MAAPTNVRVESNSVTSAIIRWTYPSVTTITIWRALHGGAYTSIGITTTSEFLDEEVDSGVFYDYKVSDDDGATFSSVVSVVIQKCPSTTSTNQPTNVGEMPKTAIVPSDEPEIYSVDGVELGERSPSGDGVIKEVHEIAKTLKKVIKKTQKIDITMNMMADKVEATLGTQLLTPDNCEGCIADGSLDIDCADGCFNFSVKVDADVNSISVNQCEEGEIELQFPPNTTRRICGWPAGFGFQGDECFNNPVVSGGNGRTMKVPFGKGRGKSAASKKGYGKGAGGAAGKGGVACACKTTGNNNLTIKSCNPNNSLKCSTSKSLALVACGGRPPYTWSKTGSVTLDRTTGDKVTVKPPTNSGSAVVGEAYRKYFKYPCSDAGDCSNCFAATGFGCGDALNGAQFVDSGVCDPTVTCGGGNLTSCNQLACKICSTFEVGTCSNFNPGNECDRPCALSVAPWNCKFCNNNFATGWGSSDPEGAFLCDKRTAPMIAAGCNPCGLQIGSTVSVTDSLGTVTTIILTG